VKRARFRLGTLIAARRAEPATLDTLDGRNYHDVSGRGRRAFSASRLSDLTADLNGLDWSCRVPGFDEDDDFEEAIIESEGAVAPGAPVEGEVEDEIWDESDFDEEFDEDFDAEPDEDLERFEQELNAENLQQDADKDIEGEFGDDDEF
jgi:hypothetical protein